MGGGSCPSGCSRLGGPRAPGVHATEAHDPLAVAQGADAHCGPGVPLESYIDEPQLRYFDEVVGPQLREGDSIILCSAVPAGVKATEDGHSDTFATLDYFDRKVIRKRNAVIRLALTGDAHHYARYAEEAAGAQKITAGGGGAFLAATHHLPRELQCPGAASMTAGRTVTFTLQHAYPTQKDSKRMRWRPWGRPTDSPTSRWQHLRRVVPGPVARARPVPRCLRGAGRRRRRAARKLAARPLSGGRRSVQVQHE